MGVFEHVHKDHAFEDSYLFYSITKPKACVSCKDDISCTTLLILKHIY